MKYYHYLCKQNNLCSSMILNRAKRLLGEKCISHFVKSKRNWEKRSTIQRFSMQQQIYKGCFTKRTIIFSVSMKDLIVDK